MQELANQLCAEHVNQLVQQICQQQTIDFFLAYYPFTIQAFASLPKAIPLICDTVEVFTLPRQDSNGAPIQPVLRFSVEEERSMLADCDIALGIQEVESRYLQNLLPNHTILTVGVDSELPAESGLPSQAAQVIGILGSDHRANQEGLQDFLQQCWPAIKQACPAAELHLAGKLGVAFQQQWPGELPAGVRILGWLAELGNYYRNLRLVVNPVTRGTGLKIKTVEALGHSRPVVAFAVGLEGIDRDQDGGWLEVDNPKAMAEACIALLQDPERCDAIAKRALQFATQHLSAENVYQPLRAILRG
jgi:glycosyltransferase involved in cell wall biosynthesis